MIGRVLGFLWGAGMYRNVARTASIEAARLQLEWDVMTPDQQQRVARARLARKREAAAAAELRAAERWRKIKLYGPRVLAVWVAGAVNPALGVAVMFALLAWWMWKRVKTS